MSVVRRAHAAPAFPASYDVTKAIPAFVERYTVLRLLLALCATASALTSCFARDTLKWIQIGSTVSALQARSNAPMAFDSARGKAVLFGGSDGTNVLSDTWEWDTGAWRKAASTGPSARESACMAYDSIRGRTVLFGGSDGTNAFSDTWEWDGSCWTKVSTTGPSARSAASMAYGSTRARTVFFGGYSPSGCLSDLWEYGVVHTISLADAATALRLAGGLTSAASSTISMLNVGTSGSSAGTVDIADAVLIARRAAGLDLNP